MDILVEFASGFMNLFKLGGEQFVGWVTGIIPTIVMLLVLMNAIMCIDIIQMELPNHTTIICGRILENYLVFQCRSMKSMAIRRTDIIAFTFNICFFFALLMRLGYKKIVTFLVYERS